MLHQTILMTGASSFVGSHLLKRLLHEGCDVLALKRPATQPQLYDKKLTWIDWTELDSDSLILDKVSSIVHLATDYGRNGSTLAEQYQCNVNYPIYLLELMKKNNIKKFISTDSFFGKYESQYSYMKSYIMSKRHFLEVGRLFTELNKDISIINMRLEHVYGANDKNNKFIPFIINEMLNGRDIIKCTICTQRRDFIYIEDVVSAYITILKSDMITGFEEFEVGTGISTELRNIVDEIKINIGNYTKVEYGAIPIRADEIMESQANIEKLEKLGWKANYTISQGVKKMLSQYKK
ncbi:UDP-glucose 4-epimerase [Pragia fontium]|uniref:NAD-dependent epimerase/dehydratase family protein n=1 Tax=Pragia fontium TaxID=82985 RepID=UPI000E03CA37|nr:NAD-dependent epimerase/dehydratase [Pragia fontium]SUB83281.1 UDP-glucose 4-epimerase [Pragia fontium]